MSDCSQIAVYGSLDPSLKNDVSCWRAVAEGFSEPYPRVSLEWLIAVAPEVTSPVARFRQSVAPAAAPSNVPNAARIRGDRPAATNYVKAEVRRILIMAGTLTAVLIVISVFL